ncbi:hypothetical protein GCM10023144_16550 [Pigmentiphaga soli]|uniref:Enoyl-CoA hydratase n=1 Tax=Pigmentiphaga soli TaxID=1007095 RepID=A0ABP8GT41_9BURK
MIEHIPADQRRPRLTAAGLPDGEVDRFLADLQAWEAQFAAPGAARGRRLDADLPAMQAIGRQGRQLLARLPLKSARDEAAKAAGHAVFHLLAAAGRHFFRAHAHAVYRELTREGTAPLRVEELARRAAERLPGVMPSDAELLEESQRMQKDKDGLELNQGLFFSQLFADRAIGAHLIRAMLRPLPQSLALLDEFRAKGSVQLERALVEAEGHVGRLTFQNPRYLNAEDTTTMIPFEIGTDLILLHPDLRIGVMRGGVVDHPKYAGRRVFSAGINLSHIYHGQQTYMSFLIKNMGFFNKAHRGLVLDPADSLEAPLDEPEDTLEKPWVAAVDTFAIGGGCQILLLMDYVIAEAGSYFNLPARKEGIIPGLANLRMPRFTGESLAREAIMFDKAFPVESPEARTVVNQVVPADDMDAAIEACVAKASGSGMTSIGGNRKALRIALEPMDDLRRYLATYAYEQLFCHLSEDLIRNLEKNWNAQNKKR